MGTYKIANGYLKLHGINIMVFDDIYPEGHQSGIGIIMHGNRVATNGDIRFEQTPGQWQPVPKLTNREIDEDKNTIAASLAYPDPDRHLKGMNPMIYPDFAFNYTVTAAAEGENVNITVDLDRPIPEKYAGKICFNLELFPGALFGKPWIMGGSAGHCGSEPQSPSHCGLDPQSHGIFPPQPNGPVKVQATNYNHIGEYEATAPKANAEWLSNENKDYNPFVADDLIAEPYAVGKCFTVCPDDPLNRLTIESKGTELKLYDGRMNHNNGWFVISSEIPLSATNKAIQWVITPNIVEDWLYTPVIQISQVGYHPAQIKTAVIELDERDTKREKLSLYKITTNGIDLVTSAEGVEWGRFLRYNYLKFDFTEIKNEGLYKICYGQSESSIFRIAADVYERGVWQPVLEYFLPVQMCHMRVNEKYRVWHGLCHMDDARMAPVNFNHFDGYTQMESTLTKYKPGDTVPGLNVGGWHDAGDFDLRVESQAGEIYALTLAYECFDVYYDATTIDQNLKVTEIHQPDGKNDILQQIEHGLLSVVSGYRALGRLYRGIIENDIRQYVLLGDSSTMTDGISGNNDDRWVFTENNPKRELTTVAELAAAARVMKGFNDDLSKQALDAARELFDITDVTGDHPFGNPRNAKLHAAAELFLTTNEQKYKDFLLSEVNYIVENITETAWFIARVDKAINDTNFSQTIRETLPKIKNFFEERSAETPYGVPYRPHIWGAGWGIQGMAYQYYFLHDTYPDIFGSEMIYNALNFILGCHPGSNNISFASGIGTKSATIGYGLNRADWSYIPGGVISGTALIRPDFPELLDFPFLWQQTEYVMGGGSSHYMFLVLAVRKLLGL